MFTFRISKLTELQEDSDLHFFCPCTAYFHTPMFSVPPACLASYLDIKICACELGFHGLYLRVLFWKMTLHQWVVASQKNIILIFMFVALGFYGGWEF